MLLPSRRSRKTFSVTNAAWATHGCIKISPRCREAHAGKMNYDYGHFTRLASQLTRKKRPAFGVWVNPVDTTHDFLSTVVSILFTKEVNQLATRPAGAAPGTNKGKPRLIQVVHEESRSACRPIWDFTALRLPAPPQRHGSKPFAAIGKRW